MTEIVIKLSQPEIRQLRQNAERELRLPEQQARMILRRALGFDLDTPPQPQQPEPVAVQS